VPRPLPPSVTRAGVRLIRAALDETAAAGAGRVLVLGDPGPSASAAVAAVAAEVSAVDAPDGLVPDAVGAGFDVVAALAWLHRVPEPDAALRGLATRGAHLVLATPREPLAARGVRLRPGRSWSSPGFLRIASTVGAVRAVVHPPGWTVLWIRSG